MTTEAPTPAPAPRRRARKAEKKSVWQMELGAKKGKEAEEEQIERPPFVATLPQVNLLPTQVRDSLAIRRMARWAALAVAALILITGALWWLQGSTIATAEADLAAAQSENQSLQSDLEALAPVKQMYEQITRLQDLVTTTLAAQPQASVVIARLADAAASAGGGAITFTNVDVTYSGIPTPGAELNTCPNPDPFGSEITIGCLTFSANAENREQVSALLRALESDPLFVGPYVTSTTATEVADGQRGDRTRNVVAFSGSTGVGIDALTTALTAEQVAAIVTPPTPEPSASASPTATGE